MRRDEFLLSPGREDTPKDRRRARDRDIYHVEGEHLNAGNMILFCPAHHGSPAAHESHDPYSHTQPVDPSSSKLVYLEAMQLLLRDRLQSTWGRVQQKEEMDYEPFVEWVLMRLRSRLTRIDQNVLEEFEGFVDQFDGDVAHVTLKTQSGETFYGEYPAADLKAQRIHEHRRFKCWTVEVGSGVDFVMEPIADRELSEEHERQIDEWLLKSLGDDNAPQNDE